MAGVRVGVDVGGTFTDVVAIDERGQIHYAKVPSTPSDQSVGVVHALHTLVAKMGVRPADVQVFVHGTTVATNTLLERKGARVGLLTTRGFRDVLHIGRQSRPHLYDLYVERPEPLVPRRFRREIHERTLATGEIEHPVDPAEVRRVVREVCDAGCDAVAICFLHAYANPENEVRAAAAARTEARDAPVSVSSEVLPEFREFERMNTTVLNAYLQAAVGRYIGRLAARLREEGVPARLLVMRSNGGVATEIQARAQAVQTLLSGPAGGVLGAAYLAEVTATGHLITADMGGTSFDVAVIEGGRPRVRSEGTIEGYPIKFPHLDIHSIGAGGGSIAWIDRAGGLRVGPQSAGALPGPICYGRGGREPTVTDAHAALGRLGTLLGGTMSLDVEAARGGLATHLGTPLGLSIEQAADGVLRVVNAAMARAIRVMTVERGIDPRRFTLVAFGGAGPLHAVDLARGLGMLRVMVPVAPGNFSALGLLAAPVREDRVRTYRVREGAVEYRGVTAALGALESEAVSTLREDGFDPSSIRCERSADLRYVGQAYELTVPVPVGEFAEPSWRTLVAGYHRAHERAYGFAKPDDPVELINLRLTALVDVDRPQWEAHPPVETTPQPVTERPAWFGGRSHRCPVYPRDRLRAGHRLDGPAVIEEHGATTVVGPGDRASVDPWGNIHLTVAVSAVAAPGEEGPR